MDSLIQRARQFATRAHRRIDHRRKYTNQPYDVHLKAVADLVATVTDDEEMIAAAWLHDSVEDTPATLQDIEREFGPSVTLLVRDLTDVSRSSDGNRTTRKTIDRRHSAAASPRAKTVKLADLIDNTADIAANDPRFAAVYLNEVAALLDVLGEGDPRLLDRARTVLDESAARLELTIGTPAAAAPGPGRRRRRRDPLRHFFRAFSAEDIAEPLRSFDGDQPAERVRAMMEALGLGVAGVRAAGVVTGFIRPSDLADGELAISCARPVGDDQMVEGTAPISDVIDVLTRHDLCFVSLLGSVAGIVTRADIQKPLVRMWLFGIITAVEIDAVTRIRSRWPDGGWKEHVPDGRLAKASQLQEERRRRDQECDLLDCLQLTDKAVILIQDPEQLAAYGFSSKKSAKRVIKELASLRNNLAHAQDIVTTDWPQIARMTRRVELEHDDE